MRLLFTSISLFNKDKKNCGSLKIEKKNYIVF